MGNFSHLENMSWEDDSPPNLMVMGEELSSAEAKLVELGKALPKDYVGAESVLEEVMLSELDFNEVIPCYKEIFEYVIKSEADLKDDALAKLYQPLLEAIQGGEEKVEEGDEKTSETVLRLQDEGEKVDLANFLNEAMDQLEELENQIPELREQRTNWNFLNTLFRRIHTIKGASGFFGLTALSHISHELENVMDKARNGKVDIDDEVVSLLVKGGEWMKNHLDTIMAILDDISLPAEFNVDNGAADPVHFGCLAVLSRPDSEVEMKKTEASADSQSAAKTTIQISQDYLDDFIQDVGDLLNLAHIFKHSETTLASSGLGREEIQRFKLNFLALEEKTDGLQKRLMQLRRVPIKQLLDKIPKIVFKLCQVVSKKVKVEIEGEDVEIDRSMLAVLEDPFVHILRNSMDHGIESPADRVELGKSSEGLFRIKVVGAQSMVHISIEDDGKGIDGNMVAGKAVEKGVISQAEFDAMSGQQKQEMIFAAGFSTKEQTTEISGRGVGMDVVRSKVVDAGGSISLSSVLGKGTKLTISLPVAATLSTRVILRVKCGSDWFGVPMDDVECISNYTIADGALPHSGGLELFPYRGNNIPVLNLSKLFGLDHHDPEQDDPKEVRSFVILKELEAGLAIEVDDFSEFETHVMQNFLEDHFDRVPFEGCSVLGDGSICLLISTEMIMKLAQFKSVHRSHYDLETDVKGTMSEARALIVQPSMEDLQLSINMDSVIRIDSFDSQKIDIIKRRRVYHSTIGLVQFYELNELELCKQQCPDEEFTTVILLNVGTRKIALGVKSIVDMYSGEIEYLGALHQKGIQNSWTYNEHLVGEIDMNYIFAKFLPSAPKVPQLSTVS